MPARDGTGPRGKGSRTGRGQGNCPPGSNGVAPRDGRGYGRGYIQGPLEWRFPLGRKIRIPPMKDR